jgi:hypothetical protein
MGAEAVYVRSTPLNGNRYQQFVPRRFHRFPTIHYAIFLAQNVNTTATDRTLASKTLAVPEPLTRYFSVSIYGRNAGRRFC